MKNKVLFLTLKTFSATGGIEKVCKCFGKVLHENSSDYSVYSLYDKQNDAIDNKYFSLKNFKGYGKRKVLFAINSLLSSRKSNFIVLSHINLLPIGWMIKQLFPRKKLLMIAHGIEVWSVLGKIKKSMLNVVDGFVAVSHFTKNKITIVHQVPSAKCKVIQNCIDPFLNNKVSTELISKIKKKHCISNEDKVVFTLTRLGKVDRKKGCENVIRALSNVNNIHKNIKYVISGNYDLEEKMHLTNLATSYGVSEMLIFTGFIPDKELGAYYNIADVFIMPSTKEGFGIVFLEAMYFGLPVIGGNMDGSTEPLCNGKLGTLIDPHNISSIEEALIKNLNDKNKYLPNRKLLMSAFSFETYKSNWVELLNSSVKLS